MSDLKSFPGWIESTALSTTIKAAGWIVPTVQSIHIVAICVVFVSVAMLDLRLVGALDAGKSIEHMARRYLPPVWWALPVLAATGVVMILGEPERELLSPFFWSKMGLLATVLALTLGVVRLLEDRPLAALAAPKRVAIQVAGALSLLLWVAIIFCGRWIAYG